MESPTKSSPSNGVYSAEEAYVTAGVAHVRLANQIHGRSSALVKPPGVAETLVLRMIRTCLHAGGVGLHAIQIGVPYNFFVMTRDGGTSWTLCVNPSWEPVEGSTKVTGREGCLSLPRVVAKVPRVDSVVARWWNRDLTVETVETLTGLDSVIFQHETEHGEGKTIKRWVGK